MDHPQMNPIKIDVAIVARELKLAPQVVETTLALLDAGNTIPFLARFRKDSTGGLDEDRLLEIQHSAARLRALVERKSTILRTLDGQGNVSSELRRQVESATTNRQLEDIYSPFKTKKQSVASLARQQGLGPLADEILAASATEIDLAGRATEFVRVDKGLASVDDVIGGVRELIAEQYSLNDKVRVGLRKLFRETASIKVNLIAMVQPESPKVTGKSDSEISKATDPTPAPPSPQSTEAAESATDAVEPVVSTDAPATVEVEPVAAMAETPAADAPSASDSQSVSEALEAPAGSENSETETSDATVALDNTQAEGDASANAGDSSPAAAVASGPPAKKKKKKKKKKQPDPYRELEGFEQPLGKLAHHQTLLINRAERAGRATVQFQADDAKAIALAEQELVPSDHLSSEFLKTCVGHMLSEHLSPVLTRELRRGITEQAEQHAVQVFAKNLKNLLLQRPVRNRTILAIDPGYKRGCSVAVIDPHGNYLESGQIFVVGSQARRDESRLRIRDWVQAHDIDIVAIGSGSACREVEQMVGEVIAQHLADHRVQYTVVNEAGANVYASSEVGREDFPDLPPSVRGAVSIGRRLQEPLAELVKIPPADINVGTFQHDVKSNHLSQSLEDVVRTCVNQVGVDVNVATDSQLKYVSGINALTARRVVEHRAQHGRFNNLNELKQVTGFGDTTYDQSAGFLRIHGGDNPLDATAIHPENYAVADDLLARVGAKIGEVFPRWLLQPSEQELARQQAPSTESTKIPAKDAPADSDVPGGDTADAVATSAASDGAPVAKVEPQPEVAAAESSQAAVAVPGDEPVSAAPVSQSKDPVEAAKDSSAVDRRQFDQRRRDIVKQLSELDLAEIAAAHGVGVMTVKDIIMTLKRPAWDPRDKVKKPIFRRVLLKAEDLKPEMELEAQVVNVVEFGVFVDIGLGDSSLVHVSRLSNHYIADPQQVYAIGDTMKVWVTEVVTERRRVKLTAIRPGTKKPSRRGRSGRGKPRDTNAQSRDASSSQRPATSRDNNSRGSGRRPGKYDGARKFGRKDSGNFKREKRHSKPKPVKPITDKMLSGDEPMRSFSDLVQFVKRKPDPKQNKTKDSDSGSKESDS